MTLTGPVAGRRRVAGVQAAEPEDTQVDHSALFTVQGCMGLDYFDPGGVHRNIYTLCGCIFAKRT